MPEKAGKIGWGSVLQGAKIFGRAKPLLLGVAIASPSDEPRSCHNAGACG